MTGKKTITLRFHLNLRKGAEQSTPAQAAYWTRNIKGSMALIVKDVAIEYAEKTFSELIQRIEKQVERDIEREIQNAAGGYSRMVTGAGPRLSGPTAPGFLEAKLDPSVRQSIMPGGPWAPRDPSYVERKAREGYPRSWFRRQGYLKSRMSSGNTWTKMFGPVRVAVRRKRSVSNFDDSQAGYRSELRNSLADPLSLEGGDKVRLGVASISVSALGRISAASLSNPRKKSQMLGLVMRHDEQLAHRLAGVGSYRPSLEPFLEFVMSRAIPAAVSKRIQMGLQSRIGSAGRTR